MHCSSQCPRVNNTAVMTVRNSDENSFISVYIPDRATLLSSRQCHTFVFVFEFLNFHFNFSKKKMHFNFYKNYNIIFFLIQF